jgi:hypothetical protein
MRRILAACLCVAILAGCGSSGLVYNAAYIGDRLNVPLSEVVVAVPFGGEGGRPVNLHVALVAVMNPRRAALSTYADAIAIVHRMAPRIASALVARAQQERAVTHADLPALRLALAKEAESVARQAIAKWAHAADYSVEFLITSFYLSDDSAARPGRVPGIP